MNSRIKQVGQYGLLTALIISILIMGTGFYRDISAKNDDVYEELKVFTDVIEEIEKNYVDTVDSKELIQKAIAGMVQSLDPHSRYLFPEEYQELQEGTKGEFEGVGVVITMPEGILTVVSPIEDTPAYKAGIKTGDIIVKVDGKLTREMSLWEAVKKMRGPKGTTVVITVVREGVQEPIDFKLVRDAIPIESVRSMSLKPGYGYVRIYNFTEKTTHDLKEALKALESGDTPLKGLILDFRSNPGGLLDQSIDISDLFIEEGKILSIKGRDEKQTKEYYASKNGITRNYPIVLLINGGSASASEIVAGALQDHKRALILGTTSFGKGSVQTVKPLRDGSGLKLTIARYYTPNGRSIQAKGIEPDIMVSQSAVDAGTPETESDMLKEKDLKNHLDAKPLNKVKKESDKENTTKKLDIDNTEYGSLKIETLMRDNQVVRALDILTSYNIFSEMNSADNKTAQ